MSWVALHEYEDAFTVEQHDYYWPSCGRVEEHDHVFYWSSGPHRHHCPARDDEDPS